MVCIACAVAFAAGGGVANATGHGPAPAPPPCSFTLSTPIRDGDAVIATVRTARRLDRRDHRVAVACLRPDAGAATRCEQAQGDDPARVSVPYTPGVSFVATGRGCAGWAGLSPAPDCQLLGPNSATP